MGMYDLENHAYAEGFTYVCGVDEAGRGPLAGPVVAAAVILPKGLEIEGVNDSKKLSEKKRELLYDVILEKAVSYHISVVDHNIVDEINILNAAMLAMRQAVSSLSIKPDLVLVDGNSDPHLDISTMTVVKGDSLSASIAAASILAKVYRDQLMTQHSETYPAYQFAQHKGYPTKLHYELIAAHGISPIHRKTFLKKFLKEQKNG